MSNLFAALIGAIVGGTFILAAQALDFRRRGKFAARLLLAEMKANAALAVKMVGVDHFPQEGPSPAFFSTRIWDSRAALMPDFLDDPDRIELLIDLYGNIESLIRSRLNDGSFPTGGWIVRRVADVADRMKGAADSLQRALDAEQQRASWNKVWDALRSLLQ